MNLDVIQAYQNPDTQIVIGMGGTEVIGCVLQDTTISASTQWNDPLQQLLEQSKQMAMSGLTGGLSDIAAFGAQLARAMVPVQLIPIATTVKQWTQTQGPTITLALLFLATKPGDDVRNDVNKIMKYTYPTNKGGLMVAPGEYMNVGLTGGGADSGSVPDGVITLRIGRWFAAKNIMIINGESTPTYSKEVIASTGKPLWAQMSVTFTPYRAITYDDWMSFFP